jgi:hypothetical protein
MVVKTLKAGKTAVRALPMDPARLAPRQPRHPTCRERGAPVSIEIGHNANVQPFAAWLQNVSREGFMFSSPKKLAVGERVRVVVEADSTESPLTLYGEVRWSAEDGDSRWQLGCRADTNVSWEQLGELFLRGVLSYNEPEV